MAETDQKPDINASEHVNIRVVAQDGNVVQFKIKKKAQLRKLMTAYTERLGLQEGSVIFLYDGLRIQREQTPNDLGMEEEAQLEVMMAQEGGG
ncbi:ubiquitin-like protein [Coccomyxa subellipsoidea C-169]|uniref:Small ubiquitin-related modifier n=1 Tax=Coccomyxa subellipsoidea (strain C-169) TaxID=574566 RepID=I0Z766_COCSC|nr:ubiquitin-like protein [Coccomyxa subellipsoidea C-169]EIE26485.1 ubiquitin-like protein [Coccomyxa subellipsoidea C-169]|eukprot:XP_005651029.1 ubiquitin-like protein [Coccomyxa subellipsoidea C-169]